MLDRFSSRLPTSLHSCHSPLPPPDFVGLPSINVSFTLGKPFLPYEQLLAVQPSSRWGCRHCTALLQGFQSASGEVHCLHFSPLSRRPRPTNGAPAPHPSAPPPRSYRVLPEPYRPLMCDPSSPIIDFYPTDFQVDLEGKREWGHLAWHASLHPSCCDGIGTACCCSCAPSKHQAHDTLCAPVALFICAGADWEGVVLIPFIDQDRLLAAAASVHPQRLTPEERQRNTLGDILVFSHAPGSCGSGEACGL